jgi:hypothetical protein
MMPPQPGHYGPPGGCKVTPPLPPPGQGPPAPSVCVTPDLTPPCCPALFMTHFTVIGGKGYKIPESELFSMPTRPPPFPTAVRHTPAASAPETVAGISCTRCSAHWLSLIGRCWAQLVPNLEQRLAISSQVLTHTTTHVVHDDSGDHLTCIANILWFTLGGCVLLS